MPSINNSETQDKMNLFVKKVGRPLYNLSTVFPFTPFPTKIEINEKIVSLEYQSFFLSKNTFPLIISDIKNVKASTNLFFGSLRFEVSGFEKNPPVISYLPRNKALKASQIILGLIILQKEDINLNKMSADKLAQEAQKLGKAHHIPTI